MRWYGSSLMEAMYEPIRTKIAPTVEEPLSVLYQPLEPISDSVQALSRGTPWLTFFGQWWGGGPRSGQKFSPRGTNGWGFGPVVPFPIGSYWSPTVLVPNGGPPTVPCDPPTVAWTRTMRWYGSSLMEAMYEPIRTKIAPTVEEPLSVLYQPLEPISGSAQALSRERGQNVDWLIFSL